MGVHAAAARGFERIIASHRGDVPAQRSGGWRAAFDPHDPALRLRPATLRLRRAGPADAGTIARTIALGFDTYRAFAPARWRPPDVSHEIEIVRQRLVARGTWCALAEVAGEPAGHVAMVADRRPGTASLWQLFVRPAWWGSGLAPLLHEAFLQQASAAGYARARLLTPAAHARARRFYERRGWRPGGPPEVMAPLGLPVIAYCRPRLS